jgi:hypothetical protein
LNGPAVLCDEYGSAASAWHGKVGMAMSSLTGFFIAVSVVALICFGLMMRSDRVRDRRRAYADSAGGDTSVISSGNDGFSLLNWFGGSSSSSSSDDSCTSSSSSFFSSSDSGCSDGGGGGGGGGDGGGGD